MQHELQVEADRQSFIAYDEAIFEKTWFTRVWFRHWDGAMRFLETAGKWIPF